jgi:hypothetical protein
MWKVNHRKVARWLEAPPSMTAETPEFASLAAEWLDPVKKIDGGTLFAGQRELSPDELNELSQFATQLWKRRLPQALLFAAWWALFVARDLVAFRFASITSDAFFLFDLFFTYLFLRPMVRLIQASSKSRLLYKDSKIGKVIILRVRSDATNGEGEEESENQEPDKIEQLPISNFVWTVGNRPAKWRVTKR